MSEKHNPVESQNQEAKNNQDSTPSHPLATGLGAAGGGAAGAALGHSMGGKTGAVVGGVAGAVAGGIAGETIAKKGEKVGELLQLPNGLGFGLGADNQPIELPRHYSWEELQALSKPQGGEIQQTI